VAQLAAHSLLGSQKAKRQQKVPAQAWPEVKALLVEMRNAPSREKAEQRREAMVERYQHELPELCRCLLDDADASLNHLAAPQRHQHHRYKIVQAILAYCLSSVKRNAWALTSNR
jgi:transposase-like protein